MRHSAEPFLCLFLVILIQVALLGAPQEAATDLREVRQVDEGTEIVLSHLFDPDGKQIRFVSEGTISDFMRTAEVTVEKKLSEGTTGALRVILEKDGRRVRAIFRDVKINEKKVTLESGRVLYDFRDDAIFECAAYRLGKLLGLNHIPPAVPRRVKGKEGTLQLWIEGAMMERDRSREKSYPDNRRHFMLQHQLMRCFDNLIANEDRNSGNILYTKDWQMWLIDHTRSFTVEPELKNASAIVYFEKTFVDNMRNLDKGMLDEHVGPFLTDRQIRALLTRRDLLLEHVDSLIAKRGEEAVFFSLLESAHEQATGP